MRKQALEVGVPDEQEEDDAWPDQRQASCMAEQSPDHILPAPDKLSHLPF